MKLKEHFFIIDSENLKEVQSRLYGFYIDENRVIFPENIDCYETMEVTGIGSYDLIIRESDQIRILQDALGSQGIYLFQDKEYFALSNSELFLMEYLKENNRTVSLNRDYACHLIPEDLAVYACTETIANEISLLERDSVVTISIPDKQMVINRIDGNENSLPIDTEEGIANLDQWMKRWGTIIRNIYASGGDIEIDLSGGFDSRMSILIALNAGIGLDDVMVRSLDDGLFCHDDDFRIASMIAKTYGFNLNDNTVFRFQDIPIKMSDIISISLYTKGMAHKQMYYKTAWHDRPKYRLTGAGGENRRHDKAHRQPADIMNAGFKKVDRFFSHAMKEEAREAEKRVLSRTDQDVKRALEKVDNPEAEISRRMLMDSWWRYHFGNDMFECLLANEIKLLPLLDPDLMKLKRSGARGDDDLLMALILVRYGAEMVGIPFEGGRSISEETISYARELCEKYPWKRPKAWTPLKRPESVKKTETTEATKFFSEEQVFNRVRMLAADVRIRKSFCSVFDEETYYILQEDSYQRAFRPLIMLNGIIAVGLTCMLSESGEKDEIREVSDLIDSLQAEDYIDVSKVMLRDALTKKDEIREQKKRLQESEKLLKKQESELNSIKNSRSYNMAKRLSKLYGKLHKKE